MGKKKTELLHYFILVFSCVWFRGFSVLQNKVQCGALKPRLIIVMSNLVTNVFAVLS